MWTIAAFCVFSLLQLLGSSEGLSATTCHPSRDEKTKLLSLYYNIFCNNGSRSSYRLDKLKIQDANPFSNFVIVVHSGHYGKPLLTALEMLSIQGTPTILVDMQALYYDTAKAICERIDSIKTPVVILNFADLTLEGLCPLTGGCDSIRSSSRIDPSLTLLISQCHNTVWLDRRLCANLSDPCSILRVYGIGDTSKASPGSRVPRHSTESEESARMLQNKTLRVATLPAETGPFVEKCNEEENGTVAYCGFLADILDGFLRVDPCRYEVITDYAIGIIDQHGNSSGVVGLAQRREVDIAVYDISITEARKAIIDFAPPFYFHSTSILILAPEPQHTVKLWAWTSPFGWIVWACLIATLIVVSLFLYAGHVFGPTELWAHKKFHSIAECVAYIGSGVINQGHEFSPHSWWGQTLLSLWWIVCVLEIASYSSFLVATLTAPNPQQLPFSTLHELADLVTRGEYKVCLPGGTAFYDELMKSSNPDYKQISSWLRYNQKYVANSSGACVQLMTQEPNVAFMDRTSTLEQYQKRACGHHQFILLEERLYTRPVSFGFPKDSPYMAAFSEKLSDIVEEGLMDLWYRNYSRASDKCIIVEMGDLNVIKASMKRLDLDDLAGVFVLLCMGIGISCTALLLEYEYHRRNLVASGQSATFISENTRPISQSRSAIASTAHTERLSIASSWE